MTLHSHHTSSSSQNAVRNVLFKTLLYVSVIISLSLSLSLSFVRSSSHTVQLYSEMALQSHHTPSSFLKYRQKCPVQNLVPCFCYYISLFLSLSPVHIQCSYYSEMTLQSHHTFSSSQNAIRDALFKTSSTSRHLSWSMTSMSYAGGNQPSLPLDVEWNIGRSNELNKFELTQNSEAELVRRLSNSKFGRTGIGTDR